MAADLERASEVEFLLLVTGTLGFDKVRRGTRPASRVVVFPVVLVVWVFMGEICRVMPVGGREAVEVEVVVAPVREPKTGLLIDDTAEPAVGILFSVWIGNVCFTGTAARPTGLFCTPAIGLTDPLDFSAVDGFARVSSMLALTFPAVESDCNGLCASRLFSCLFLPATMPLKNGSSESVEG